MHKSECQDDSVRMLQLRSGWPWCFPEHFPMKDEILSSEWSMVRKENFISYFKTSFQPVLDCCLSPPCSHCQILSSAGPPARLTILQGRPKAYSSTKPPLHGMHLSSSSNLTILWDGMYNRGLWKSKRPARVWLLGCRTPEKPDSRRHHNDYAGPWACLGFNFPAKFIFSSNMWPHFLLQ